MKVSESKQVKMVDSTHKRVKIFSVMRGRKFYEVVDTACNEYLDKQEVKAPRPTEKTE